MCGFQDMMPNSTQVQSPMVSRGIEIAKMAFDSQVQGSVLHFDMKLPRICVCVRRREVGWRLKKAGPRVTGSLALVDSLCKVRAVLIHRLLAVL